MTKGRFSRNREIIWEKEPVRERPKEEEARLEFQSDRSEESSEIDKVRGVLIRLMGIINLYVMGSGLTVRNVNRLLNLGI